MNIDQFRELLRTNQELEFSFKKRDGSVREACGTLSPKVLEANFGESSFSDKSAPSPTNVTYFDLDACAWRSFVFENLVSVNGEEING